MNFPKLYDTSKKLESYREILIETVSQRPTNLQAKSVVTSDGHSKWYYRIEKCIRITAT